MAKTQIIVGLDIGTDTIKIVGAQKNADTGMYDVRFLEKVKSFGLRKGRVKSEEELLNTIRDLLNKVEEKYNFRINSVLTNINGSKLEVFSRTDHLPVSKADNRVSESEKERLIDQIKSFNAGNNKRVLSVLPLDWILDEKEKEIDDPVNLHCSRLGLEALLLYCFSSDIDKLINVLSDTGFDLDDEDLVPNPIADAEVLLTPQQKDLGVVLIDIGVETTGMVVYKEGKVLDLAVFPYGSGHITNDIAIGLQTEIEIAERIKKEHYNCDPREGNKGKKIEIKIREGDEEDSKEEVLTFSEKELKKIAGARVKEILDWAKERLKNIPNKPDFPAGIVLTGGGAKMKGLVELIKREMKLPCKIGFPENFAGIEKDPELSSVCGLIVKGELYENERGGNWGGGFTDKIRKVFKNFSI